MLALAALIVCAAVLQSAIDLQRAPCGLESFEKYEGGEEMAGESLGVLMAGAAVKGGTSTAVKLFLSEVVAPYLRGMNSKRSETQLKFRLSKYAKIIENKTRYVSTFASTSGLVAFDELYEPLRIRPSQTKKHFLIDSYPSELFRESRCIALTDDAGMGKSTLAKYIVRRAIVERKGIPLLIELRRLRSGQSIMSCLSDELAGGAVNSAEGEALVGLFERGNFIFVLDGFDEIEESLRPAVVDEVNSISARFQFCYFMLTSRPEYSVSLFPAFMQAEIVKLSRDQANSLIERCDAERGIAKILISRVDEANVSDFLGNPLLVTLLYRAFDYRNSVPPKRTIFFRQVYDALFQDHDLAKGDAFSRKKECGLDSEDFHKLLRALGFETFRCGRVSYGHDELMSFIDKAVGRSGFSVEPRKVLQDVLKAVPIFQKDGLEFRWSHKSFQEYFASQCILSDMGDLRSSIIERMFSSPEVSRYREVFRFFGEFDVGLIRELCIFPLLKELDEFAAGFDYKLASLHFAVYVYYISRVDGDDDAGSPNQVMRKYFGLDVAGRRMAVNRRSKSKSLFIGVMKDPGPKFLLLPVIDKKMFPFYLQSSIHSAAATKLAGFLGAENRHINPSLGELAELHAEVGSIECIEAAASLLGISRSTFDAVAEAEQKRIDAIAPSVLDDF
ncbi:NACHT domain-containing protein [Stenotrophomonas maltophilia]|uniref:NACHT domain-containing protein n=1 Tax=Stenotrophomonas maltophilia TaxID=40324 RepID=A0AAJ2TLS2_STEMA|nr:NACHT domain-containing protein [Stenotrophomonas maltophilia]MDZ5764708.1 NACHT domain-containing protein [Stenotrophomonas maltophilia]